MSENINSLKFDDQKEDDLVFVSENESVFKFNTHDMA